jgi:hypothetical protein
LARTIALYSRTVCERLRARTANDLTIQGFSPDLGEHAALPEMWSPANRFWYAAILQNPFEAVLCQ